MKHILRYLASALLLTVIPFSVMQGENFMHNFNDMIPLGTISFGLENTSAKATTDDVTYTYTCGEDAKFDVVSTVVGIKMYEEGDYVIVSPAIAGLNKLRIGYNAIAEKEEIEVYISPDGDFYGRSPLAEGVTYYSGLVEVVIPQGDYQVMIRNKGSKDIFVTRVTYYYEVEECNCFRYVP
jgi:hypothetical protein